MVAPAGVVWSRARIVLHGGEGKATHGLYYVSLASPGEQVKASHCVRALRCAGLMFVDIQSSREQGGCAAHDTASQGVLAIQYGKEVVEVQMHKAH